MTLHNFFLEDWTAWSQVLFEIVYTFVECTRLFRARNVLRGSFGPKDEQGSLAVKATFKLEVQNL